MKGTYDVCATSDCVEITRTCKKYYFYIISQNAIPFIARVPQQLNEQDFMGFNVESLTSTWYTYYAPQSPSVIEIAFKTTTEEENMIDAFYTMSAWFEQIDNWRRLINNDLNQPNVGHLLLTTSKWLREDQNVSAPSWIFPPENMVEEIDGVVFKWNIKNPNLLWVQNGKGKGIPDCVKDYLQASTSREFNLKSRFPSMQRKHATVVKKFGSANIMCDYDAPDESQQSVKVNDRVQIFVNSSGVPVEKNGWVMTTSHKLLPAFCVSSAAKTDSKKIRVGDTLAYLDKSIDLSECSDFIVSEVTGINEDMPCWVELANYQHVFNNGNIDVALYDPVNVVLLSKLAPLSSYK